MMVIDEIASTDFDEERLATLIRIRGNLLGKVAEIDAKIANLKENLEKRKISQR